MEVARKDGFQIFFDALRQEYTVFKDGRFLIGGKNKFSQVKAYIE